MTSTESEIRALIDRRSEAIRAKDIDALMSVFSTDIVYFDTVAPLRYVGSEALRKRFLHWFDGWTTSIGQEVRDLKITADSDLAAAFMLVRAKGTLKSGQRADSWVRVTSFCQHLDQRWLITHEHVSFPVDVVTGNVVRDAQP